MKAEPQQEHQWLDKLVGDWTYEIEATMEPGKPPQKLSATGKVLTLDTEGPDFAIEGKLVKYQDIIEFKSDDHRVLSSQTLGDDGQWRQFMTAHYRRKK